MEETAAASPAAATAAGCDAAAREKAPETGASPSGTSVRLLIKSSNQQYEDLNVDSDLCWTVQRLKKQLSMVYPGKPVGSRALVFPAWEPTPLSYHIVCYCLSSSLSIHMPVFRCPKLFAS